MRVIFERSVPRVLFPVTWEGRETTSYIRDAGPYLSGYRIIKNEWEGYLVEGRLQMESRKRPVNGYDNGRSARPKEDNGSHTATDEEVEEFFAILRRMHAAGKQIRRGSGNGNGVEMTEKAVRWRPVFEWEDFVGPNAVNSNGEGKSTENRKTQEKSAVFGRLDLNAEPEPEPERPADSSGNL